jgi:hypothetical protein
MVEVRARLRQDTVVCKSTEWEWQWGSEQVKVKSTGVPPVKNFSQIGPTCPILWPGDTRPCVKYENAGVLAPEVLELSSRKDLDLI